MNKFFQLKDRAIIEISGLDCKEFLQGLITNDIKKINDGGLIYSCMLNAQGRFLYDFFIFERNGKVFVDCYAPRVDEILKKLGFYKLRAKVEIRKNEEMGVFFGEKKVEEGLCFIDPRNANMKYRVYSSPLVILAAGGDPGNESNTKDLLCDEFSWIPAYGEDDKGERGAEKQNIGEQTYYHYLRITNKIPESEYDLTYEKSFISEFGFDNLNAIDYNKGCYVGQEPTARIHHLGQIRKEILYVKLLQKPEKNSEITCEDGTSALALSSVYYKDEFHALILKKLST